VRSTEGNLAAVAFHDEMKGSCMSLQFPCSVLGKAHGNAVYVEDQGLSSA
jgi:hypothetical protein